MCMLVLRHTAVSQCHTNAVYFRSLPSIELMHNCSSQALPSHKLATLVPVHILLQAKLHLVGFIITNQNLACPVWN